MQLVDFLNPCLGGMLQDFGLVDCRGFGLRFRASRQWGFRASGLEGPRCGFYSCGASSVKEAEVAENWV